MRYYLHKYMRNHHDLLICINCYFKGADSEFVLLSIELFNYCVYYLFLAKCVTQIIVFICLYLNVCMFVLLLHYREKRAGSILMIDMTIDLS